MILALDTATLQSSVALVGRDGALVAARRARVTTHSEALLGLIRDVLAEARLAPSELAAIACGAGPGSFTGLRIGLATAKGLCLATGRPLLMVSSLAALAARVRAPGDLVVPCLDAWKGEVYAGFYRAGDPPEPLEQEMVGSVERVVERIAALQNDHAALHIVGDGPAQRKIVSLMEGPALRLPTALHDEGPPDAAEVGRLAAHRLRRGERDDLAAAAPRYIRPSEAELAARKGMP